jgi:lipoprotein-anchoring transpeptidase ErfK/SrfK
MRRSPRTLIALALGLTLLVSACGGGESPRVTDERLPSTAVTTPGAPAATVPPRGDYIVQAAVPELQVYDAPDDTNPSQSFENPWYYATDTQRRYPITSVFFSEEQRDGWVKVLLPVRPNGSNGWVRASDVRLVPSRFRIEVDLSEHRLTVYEGDAVFLEDTVAVGKPVSPTPVGRFYLRILVRPPDPTTVYGPYAYGLSSHSEAFSEFNGGEAQVGIHGNNDASVLGENVSAGCIRMDNDKITRLASTLPLGTPVEVRE